MLYEVITEIKVDYNGFSPGIVAYRGGKGNMSNVMIIPMPDGKRYMLVPRFTSVIVITSYSIHYTKLYDPKGDYVSIAVL